MLFILFALKSEAQAFVDKFKLKKKKDLNYTLFYNNHITAIVSGVGVLNASNAVSFLLNNYTIDSDDIFINIGICGASNEYKIGELIQISQVNYKNRSCKLNNQTTLETTLFICPQGLSDFDDFLDLLAIAEPLLKAQGYEGTYQLASFHPQYIFANTPPDAAENYTNRSPYPILHLLRESSLETALLHYNDPEAIVEHNIALMNRLGTPHLQHLFNSFTHQTDSSL